MLTFIKCRPRWNYVCNAEYCDFVVWNEGELIVLRIKPDSKFIMDTIARVTTFFKYGVMPELWIVV